MRTDPQVVLVRGVMGRSGTNHLRDLLLLHPACTRSRPPVWEDFVLDDGDLLEAYVDRLVDRWPDRWQIPKEAAREELLERFGAALLDFLRADAEPDARVVLAKAPSTEGLEHHPRLFPRVPLILLVRDGRAVAQSAMRSFGWSFERAAREWLRGAKAIAAFDSVNRGRPDVRYRIVRYEDLVTDPMGTLTDLLAFVGLSADAVDPGDIEGLPVRGSSRYGTATGDGRPHWRPVPKSSDFTPQQPGEELTPAQLRRFERLAGPLLARFDYPTLGRPRRGVPTGRPPWLDGVGDHVRRSSDAALARLRRVARRAGPTDLRTGGRR